jgi:zinc transporter 5/7
LGLNIVFTVVELFVGLTTGSLGLISDAGHMLFDCASLAIGLAADFAAVLPPDRDFTYGRGRIGVLSGFVNALLLLVVAFSISVEALQRFWDPPEVHSEHLLPVAVGGLVINVVGLAFFHEHHGHSHIVGGECTASSNNMHGVYLHILADTLGSVGVILSAVLVRAFEWHIADPVCALLVSALIIGTAAPLLRQTGLSLLQVSAPESAKRVRTAIDALLRAEPDVIAVRDPHFWIKSSGEAVGTLRVETVAGANSARILSSVRSIFRARRVGGLHLSVEVIAIPSDAPKPDTAGSGTLRFPAAGARW